MKRESDRPREDSLAQGTGLVGREPERAVLGSALDEDGPLVVFIHGIGGRRQVHALLEAFTVEARARATLVLRLDCGAIEPTPAGFLAALSSATGGDLGSPEDAAARLAISGSASSSPSTGTRSCVPWTSGFSSRSSPPSATASGS